MRATVMILALLVGLGGCSEGGPAPKDDDAGADLSAADHEATHALEPGPELRGDGNSTNIRTLSPLLAPAWFDCQVLHATTLIEEKALDGRLPSGYEPTVLAETGVLVVFEAGSCQGLLIDNETYVPGSGFAVVYVQVEVPEEHRHGGGVDQYVLQVVTDDSRIVSEAEALGIEVFLGDVTVEGTVPGGTMGKIQIGDKTHVLIAAGEESPVIQTQGRIVFHWEVADNHQERAWNYNYEGTEAMVVIQEPSQSRGPLLIGDIGLAWLRQGSWSLTEGASV